MSSNFLHTLKDTGSMYNALLTSANSYIHLNIQITFHWFDLLIFTTRNFTASVWVIKKKLARKHVVRPSGFKYLGIEA